MLLDIILGIVVAIATTETLGVAMSWWHLAAGITFALMPDLDFLWHFFKKREIAAHAGNPEDHRDGLHYPLMYLSTGFAMIGMFSSSFAIMFLFASFLHFVHDSVGIGWGVKWGWPFSQKNYKLFCEKDGTFSRRFLVSWEPSDMREVIIQEGDSDWIQNLFLCPLWRAVTFREVPSIALTILLLAEVIIPLAIIVGMVVWSFL